MDLKEVKKDIIYTVIGDRLAIPKSTFEWLIEQAEKANELQKRIDKVTKLSSVDWINKTLEGKRD